MFTVGRCIAIGVGAFLGAAVVAHTRVNIGTEVKKQEDFLRNIRDENARMRQFLKKES